jgi:uncharacterized protein (UPF0303 family)
MYLTDVGFFPHAKDHYKEREDGAEQYILIYCIEGKGIIELDGQKYLLRESDVFCIPCGQKHRYYADKEDPWSILWVHFKGENVIHFPVEERKIVHINSKHSNNRMVMLFKILFRVLERNYILGNFIYISQVLSLILSEVYYREKVDESTTPLTVRITKGKQIMFHYVANDNSLDKDNWVRRKINSVMNFHHSSLWLHYKTNGDGNQLMLKYGLSMEDYTVSGGAVPIIVKGVGVIGAIAISGYSGLWEDHDMGIEALQWLKGEQHEE